MKNKTLLITGGTGSFGNAVLKKFLDTDINEIRIFSRDEKKQHDMRVALQNPKVKFYIGDVRDYQSIESAMNGVDYVLNATTSDVYDLDSYYKAKEYGSELILIGKLVKKENEYVIDTAE